MKLLPFTVVSGAAAYLPQPNLDTDTIIRIEKLAALARDELSPYCLETLRFLADGTEDPSCTLNRPAFRSAPILLAGENFGCGSSREAAVWALHGMGLRCIIAPSFGDIFFSNCFQNGLLPIRLPLDQVEALAAQCAAGAPLMVDLGLQTLTPPAGPPIRFAIDPLRRVALLGGYDDISLTLQDDELIRAWQTRDRAARPWVWAN